MPDYKCVTCEKCFNTKQNLNSHMNRLKPCVRDNIKTKFRCDRCLGYFSTKQKHTQHMNRKNKCDFYRHVPIIKTDLIKELELEQYKRTMIGYMKTEYRREVIRIYKTYGSQIQCAMRKKNLLFKKLTTNIKKVNERKTQLNSMPSIFPDKKTQVDTVDNLVKYYKILKEQIEKAELRFKNLEDEHEEGLAGIQKLLDSTYSDREKKLSIQKELISLIGKNQLRIISYAIEDIQLKESIH